MSIDLKFNSLYFPSDWEDDARMNFLFTAFRERFVNPEGYDAKLNFWVNTIQHLCIKNDAPIIKVDALCTALQRKGRQPMCLDIVFDDMIRQGLIVNRNEFEHIDESKGWLGWGLDIMIQRPMVWGFSSIQSLLNWSKKDQQFVVMSVVKEYASKVWDRYHELVGTKWTDTAVFLEHLKRECKHIGPESHFNLALIKLQKEKRVLVFLQNGEKVVKFKKDDAKRVEPLSELDKGILSLNRARDTILGDVDTLEENMTSCSEAARQFIRIGLKNKAMISLKKRKRLEALLKKKSIALDNIENLLCQLKSTGSEKMILEAYRTGVQAMKGTVSDDLGLDNIDDVMADVRETLDDYSEVQQTLSHSVSQEDDSLEVFEDELSEILAEETQQSKKKEKSPQRAADEDLMRRLAALRSPPEDSPPAKKPLLKVATRAF